MVRRVLPYVPPPGSVDLPNPRTITGIAIYTLAIHFLAVVAYIHLGTILSWSPSHRKIIVLTITFALFPELILVSLATQVTKTLGKLPAAIRRQSPATYLLSTILGTHAQLPLDLQGRKGSSRPISDFDPTDVKRKDEPYTVKWALRFTFILINSLPLALNILAYKHRLQMRYHSATYVANLGLDHRNGWVAIGGLVATTMSAIASLLRTRWVHSTPENASLPSKPLIAIHPLTETSIQICLASIVHVILVRKTNGDVFAVGFPLWTYGVCLLAAVALIGYWRASKRPPSARAMFGGLLLVWVFGIALLQMRADGRELWDVGQGRVKAGNYRWKVQNWGFLKARGW